MDSELPVIDPTITNEKSSIDHDESRFLGASKWAPWYLIFCTRFVSACALLAVAVIYTIQMEFSVVHAAFYANALGFALLAIASGLRDTHNNVFAAIVISVYGFSACFAAAVPLDLIDRFAKRYLYFRPILVLHLLPTLFYFIDVFAMKARVRLRYHSVFLATLCYVAGVLAQTVMISRKRGTPIFGSVLFVGLYTLTFLMIACVVVFITHIVGRADKEDM